MDLTGGGISGRCGCHTEPLVWACSRSRKRSYWPTWSPWHLAAVQGRRFIHSGMFDMKSNSRSLDHPDQPLARPRRQQSNKRFPCCPWCDWFDRSALPNSERHQRPTHLFLSTGSTGGCNTRPNTSTCDAILLEYDMPSSVTIQAAAKLASRGHKAKYPVPEGDAPRDSCMLWLAQTRGIIFPSRPNWKSGTSLDL
jgi:hypothetical protein